MPTLTLVLSLQAYPCTRIGRVSSIEMVQHADVIVRVVAEKYDVLPKNPSVGNGFISSSTVHFHVVEVIRGDPRTDLTLPGYLSDNDDFNDRPLPYNFVRPGGRHGNCFANTYRSGAQFLLLLQKNQSGELSMNWYPLGPVNEQLHSVDDPWLLWVRAEARGFPSGIVQNSVRPERTLIADAEYVARNGKETKTIAKWKLWHLNSGGYEVIESFARNSAVTQTFRFDPKFLPIGHSLGFSPPASHPRGVRSFSRGRNCHDRD